MFSVPASPSLFTAWLPLALLAAVTVWSRRWSGAQRLPHRYLLGAAMAVLLVLLGVVAGSLLLRVPGLPYNVKQAVGSGIPAVRFALLSCVVLISGALPAGWAALWNARPWATLLLMCPLSAAAAFAAYQIFDEAVPAESVYDLLGYPVWERFRGVELPVRFLGLYLGPIACLTLGAWLTLPGRVVHVWAGLLPLATMVGLSYYVVVSIAATDNLTELLRGGGNAACVFFSICWLTIYGVLAALLSRGLRMLAARRIVPLLCALPAVILATPLSWLLMLESLNPAVDKYGKTFAAHQFLLSPDRRYLPDAELWPRFAAIHLGAVLALSAGMLVVWMVTVGQPQANDAARQSADQ